MKEPFINHMFPGIQRPRERDFQERDVDGVLYSYTEDLFYGGEDYSCGICGEEDCHGECDPDDGTVEQVKTPLSGEPGNLTLQQIIDVLPIGITPDDVKMRFDYNDWGGRFHHTITFYYVKHMLADPEGFKQAKEKYAECERLYQIERDKYDAWSREQKRAKLKKELEELENSEK